MDSATSRAAPEPHLVQFYESDEVLAASVADFMAQGAQAGDPMLLILAAEHRDLFAERLRARGVAVQAALELGHLVLLDAAETLSTFMVGELPDGVLFDQTVGATLAELQRRHAGRRIRAFGEMVDVLWRSGKHAGAVRLEALWTGLQKRQAFSLYCAYQLGDFLDSPSRQAISCLHTHTVGNDGRHAEAAPMQLPVEEALRSALRQQQLAEVALRASERRLRDITDAVPVLVSYIDRGHRYRFANETYQQWFGLEPSAIVGAHMRDVLGEKAYRLVGPKIDAALAGKRVEFTSRAEYLHGGTRDVEVVYTPHRSDDGQVLGVTAMVQDITEKARLREATADAARKNERLLKVTAAIANAVTPEQVYEAIVDETRAALGATSAGLWVLGDDGLVRLVREQGFPERVKSFATFALDTPDHFPVIDSLRENELIWLSSREAFAARYPQLLPKGPLSERYQVASVPLLVRGRPRGSLAVAFDGRSTFEEDERPFLMLVARYAGQALERLELLAEERKSRAQAELLFGLAQAVISAAKADDMFSATLDVIEQAAGTKRSAILVYDAGGVMRFRAWRGLSDDYRRAVEGHSPWKRDAADPQIVWVGDAAADPSLAAYAGLFAREQIGALGFIPLVAGGKLLGKFMLYFDRPRTLTPRELDLVKAIANHIAAATARSLAHDELQQTVRFNEMFTAILGHDLRNPLGSIMTAAQLLLKRSDNEKLTKPLGRIMSSGGRMARMIDQLLDFTRLRVGAGIPIEPKRTDLKPVVELVVAELSESNPETRIEIELQGDTVGPWDGDRLAQVFSNLVGNAVQHGALTGRVKVLVDGRDPKALRAAVHNAGAVPPERVTRLFEPLNGTAHRGEKTQGLGLGLYISQEIARAHGGAISVESSEAAGTTFQVTLPRAAP